MFFFSGPSHELNIHKLKLSLQARFLCYFMASSSPRQIEEISSCAYHILRNFQVRGDMKLGPSNIEKSKFMDPQGLSLYFYMVSAKNSDTQEILQIRGTKHSSLCKPLRSPDGYPLVVVWCRLRKLSYGCCIQ